MQHVSRDKYWAEVQSWLGSTYTPQRPRSLDQLLLEIIRKNERLRNPERREKPQRSIASLVAESHDVDQLVHVQRHKVVHLKGLGPLEVKIFLEVQLSG